MGARFTERGRRRASAHHPGRRAAAAPLRDAGLQRPDQERLLLAGMVGGVEVALREPHGRSPRPHRAACSARSATRSPSRTAGFAFGPAAGSSRSSSRCRATRPRRRSWSAPRCWPRRASSRSPASASTRPAPGFFRCSQRMGAPVEVEELGDPVRRAGGRPGRAARRALRATEVAAGEIPGAHRRDPPARRAGLAGRGDDRLPRGRRAPGEGERPARPHRRKPARGRAAGPRSRATTSTSTGGERAAARARCGPPATTGWPWPSRCWARCRAPGSGSTTWPARR